MPTKAYIITLKADFASIEPTKRCLESIRSTGSFIDAEEFEATEPYTIRRDLENLGFKDIPVWNWPLPNLRGGVNDPASGLLKMPYAARDQRRVIACAVSHLRLWYKCAQMAEPIIVLEHDALFTRKFDETFWKVRADFRLENKVVGLNHPQGATRKASVFHERVVAAVETEFIDTFVPVPDVDYPNKLHQPYGLAGNSAYYLTPGAALHLVYLVNKYGLWPNDALMCSQLMPNMLYAVYPYYTKVQGTRSTTTS